jgi:RND family efflux transporter MFP subunit
VYSARGLVCAAALALALAGCGAPPAPPPKVQELVGVQTVQPEPVTRAVSLTGTVAARVESKLSFRTAGKIAERKVDVGAHVRAGDVLATIETREQEADVAAAKARLQAAQAALVQAQSTFGRQQQLLTKGFTTRSNFDAAQEQLRNAQGSLDSARADVGTAEEQLSFTVLKANADGVITTRDAEAGQVVAAAQTVFTLAEDGARDAVFDIYEALLTDAPPKGPVEVRLLSDPGITAQATVREVSPTFDTATGTVRVKMSLLNPPAAMSLGAAVSGGGASMSRSLIVLPWTALSAAETGPGVWVVDPASKAVAQRRVVIARYETGHILIADGLKSGDIVVTTGGQFLHEGQIVTMASGAPA